MIQISSFPQLAIFPKLKNLYIDNYNGVQFIPNINFVGGPASSVVAELYMQNHDNRALTTFENSPRIYEVKRFVDDIVSIIKRENLEQFHNHMNALHPKIQFTIEEESDGELPFLDLSLIHI